MVRDIVPGLIPYGDFQVEKETLDGKTRFLVTRKGKVIFRTKSNSEPELNRAIRKAIREDKKGSKKKSKKKKNRRKK